MRPFKTHIWSVFQVGQCGLFLFLCSWISIFLTVFIFQSPSPSLSTSVGPYSQVFLPSPYLHLFLLLLTDLHSYLSFLRSSLTNSPFFYRLVFFFSFSKRKQIFFFLSSIITAWRALKQPCCSQSSWPNEDENDAAYSCTCWMLYGVTKGCAQLRWEVWGILSMRNDNILRVIFKQFSPCTNRSFTSLS